MKNYKLLALACTAMLSFSSCSSDDNDDDTGTDIDLNLTAQTSDEYVNPASLPQPILDYISTNYPESTISEAEREDNNNIEVELRNGPELVFDDQGSFLGIDDDGDDDFGDEDIDPADLMADIRNFVNEHFPGTSIEEAERENNGNYEIELSDDTELIFDANGKFLGRADDDANDDRDDDDIAASDLPQVITDYITANYPDNSIIEAEREDDDGYEVTLNNGVELEFDAEGNLEEVNDQNGDDDDDDDNDDDDDDN